MEIWFGPGHSAGALAHNDGYCESVMSIQLRGEKKWREMVRARGPVHALGVSKALRAASSARLCFSCFYVSLCVLGRFTKNI